MKLINIDLQLIPLIDSTNRTHSFNAYNANLIC